MKKAILILITLTAFTFSCKQNKSSKEQENVVKIENKSTSTEKFVDGNGKVLIAKYNTNEEILTVTITYEEYKDEKLTQVEAWAKGAKYKSENLTWITTKTGGDFIINGKTISFKSSK